MVTRQLHDYVLRAGYEKRKVDPDAVTIGQRRVLANIRGD